MTPPALPPPKLQRLRKRPQFLQVRKGAKAIRPSLMVEARRRAEDGPVGVGFTASSKVGGAVIRNRARRRLKEAARQLLPAYGLPGVDYVIVARTGCVDASWAGLLDDLQNALIRLRAELDPAAPKASPRRRPQAQAKSAPPTESD